MSEDSQLVGAGARTLEFSDSKVHTYLMMPCSGLQILQVKSLIDYKLLVQKIPEEQMGTGTIF